MINNVVKLLGFDISAFSSEEIYHQCLESGKSCIVNTINPHSYIMSKTDVVFSDALRFSDFLIPDGSGIVLASRLLTDVVLHKVSGFDFFNTVINNADKSRQRILFIGSTVNTLAGIESKMSIDYPNVTVGTYSPPFVDEFSDSEISHIKELISSFKPDYVFIGLTAPKQEKLIANLYSSLDSCVKIISGIGAVFDFYSGVIKRPSEFWIKLHLEWLIRLLGEPKRLWRRNFISTPLFLFDLFYFKIKDICK